jgi:hypothetical protein
MSATAARQRARWAYRDIMPACKLLLPPAALSCLGLKLAERTFKATRPNVSDVCDAVAGAADLRRRFKTGQRMHRALSVQAVGVCRIDREERRRARRNLPAVAVTTAMAAALCLIDIVISLVEVSRCAGRASEYERFGTHSYPRCKRFAREAPLLTMPAAQMSSASFTAPSAALIGKIVLSILCVGQAACLRRTHCRGADRSSLPPSSPRRCD